MQCNWNSVISAHSPSQQTSTKHVKFHRKGNWGTKDSVHNRRQELGWKWHLRVSFWGSALTSAEQSSSVTECLKVLKQSLINVQTVEIYMYKYIIRLCCSSVQKPPPIELLSAHHSATRSTAPCYQHYWSGSVAILPRKSRQRILYFPIP